MISLPNLLFQNRGKLLGTVKFHRVWHRGSMMARSLEYQAHHTILFIQLLRKVD
jgi:hypothetical protein